LLLLSCAVQVAFTAVIQAAYQDERVFPFSRKATAINIIILVSKTATIGAPFVNEAEEPVPIIFLIGLSVISVIIAYFYRTKEELDSMQKVEGAVNQAPDVEQGKDDGDKI